jgi:hypothetical protein
MDSSGPPFFKGHSDDLKGTSDAKDLANGIDGRPKIQFPCAIKGFNPNIKIAEYKDKYRSLPTKLAKHSEITLLLLSHWLET